MLDTKSLLKLKNDDYQKRGGNYPKPNIPDSIDVDINVVTNCMSVMFAFKNTSEDDAYAWYEKSKEFKVINKYAPEYTITTETQQDGDFSDDWVSITVSLSSNDLQTIHNNIKEKEATKSENLEYIYCYILSTQEQRDSIDLTKYKTKLSKVIKEFFTTRLISIVIDKSTYTITLNEVFTIGDKRKLGRAISTNTDLKKYVRTVAYNGGSDKSGQLFRIKKDSDNAVINK